MKVNRLDISGILSLVKSTVRYRLTRLLQEGNDDAVNEDLVTLFDESFELPFECPDPLANYKAVWPYNGNTYDLHVNSICIRVDTKSSTMFIYSKASDSLKLPSKALVLIDCSDNSIISSSERAISMLTLWKVTTVLTYSSTVAKSNGLVLDDPELRIHPNFDENNLRITIRMAIKTSFDLSSEISQPVAENLRCIADNTFKIDSVNYNLDSPKLHEVLLNDAHEVSTRLFYRAVSACTADMLPVPATNFEKYELRYKLFPFQRQTVDWILQKENLQYNQKTSKYEPIPVVSQEDSQNLQDFRCGSHLDLNSIGQLLRRLLSKHTFGWEVAMYGSQPRFLYNKYTAQTASFKAAAKAIAKWNEEPSLHLHAAKGILAEGVRLGKTFEVAATILINQRPKDKSQEPHKLANGKTIFTAGTTLIIVPMRLLSQWVSELKRFVPSLAVTIYKGANGYPELKNIPSCIAESFLCYDVVVAAYETLSVELDHAEYSSKQQPARRSTKRKGEDRNTRPKRLRSSTMDQSDFSVNTQESSGDLQTPNDSEVLQGENTATSVDDNDRGDEAPKERGSPLMELQFWRVVIDESQTMCHEDSRALRFVALVPKHHVWCVSGIPFNDSFEDIQFYLDILQCSPFNGVKLAWKMLKSCPREFVQLCSTLTIRHTYAMVCDDFELPLQHRVVVSCQFPTEVKKRYMSMKEKFSAIQRSNTKAKIKGLEELRMFCDFSVVASKVKSEKVESHTNDTPCMKSSLQQLQSLTKEKTIQFFEIQLQMGKSFADVAEYFCFKKIPHLAIELLAAGIESVKNILRHLSVQVESAITNKDNLRAKRFRTFMHSFVIVLHEYYYLTGFAHSQISCGDVDESFERDSVDISGFHSFDYKKGLCEISNDAETSASNALFGERTNDNADSKLVSEQFYDKAKLIRQRLFDMTVNHNLGLFKSIKDKQDELCAEVSLIEFNADLSEVVGSILKVKRVEQLNVEAKLINEKSKLLVEFLDKLDSENRMSIENLEKSLCDQEELQSIRTVLNELTAARVQGLLGVMSHRSCQKELSQFDDIEDLESFQKEAYKVRSSDGPSLYEIVKRLDIAGESTSKVREETGMILALQQVSLDKLTRGLAIHGCALFDALIDYSHYVHLILDSVKENNFQQCDQRTVAEEVTLKSTEHINLKKALDEAFNELRHLSGQMSNFELQDLLMCPIDHTKISMGVQLPCGHSYSSVTAESAFETGTFDKCGICRQRLPEFKSSPEFRKFTQSQNFLRPESHPNIEYEARSDDVVTASKDHMNAIDKSVVKKRYSTKVDVIVRHILYLKSRNPRVQIVIYSQFSKMLDYLGGALKMHDITFLRSLVSTNSKIDNSFLQGNTDGAKQFKASDSTVTCFLLDAHAQDTGLNLVNANHVFFCEPLVNKFLELQVTQHIQRIGQTKSTSIWIFMIEDTVEETIFSIAEKKWSEYLASADDFESKLFSEYGFIKAMIAGWSKRGEFMSDDDLQDIYNALEFQS
ncbi:hypothetical protein DIURU_000285 [Diutina rugosa]|uniref:Helicase ATP-binding domain-containing protein n=1 Tax=Diutina rugosa TaxID=5481 RepID=A0A642V587_DIURU|nr:uncharacterized protein DIURU_000285 [Diutina rugosa]KAA8908064.1 hypothetical protein DIURU_000285 [Diutina rugosa]